ncbi:MAG: glycyl-radical enzyme activating protein [Ruminococcaceae bacterium]|nr:glycyl-radical enzyme activating protein [Oscillospiraceae bacterium]
MFGNVFNIQRFCIHDGPGIRTVVFLKGCVLRCAWCHNPESQNFEREIICRTSKCLHCGKCALVCPKQCHTFLGQKHQFDFERCTLCESCTTACPADALEIVGKMYTVKEVVNEVLKDKMFYENSEGGVTISGGEPFSQPQFTFEILKRCKENGVHTAIETCGHTSKENILKSAEVCDLYLYDYKLTDKKRHKQYIGNDNTCILENLKLLNRLKKRIVLRCPIIPGVNDTEDHFAGIVKLANAHESIEAVEIEPYHKLGEGKNEGLGRKVYFTAAVPAEESLSTAVVKMQKTCRCPVSINR